MVEAMLMVMMLLHSSDTHRAIDFASRRYFLIYSREPNGTNNRRGIHNDEHHSLLVSTCALSQSESILHSIERIDL